MQVLSRKSSSASSALKFALTTACWILWGPAHGGMSLAGTPRAFVRALIMHFQCCDEAAAENPLEGTGKKAKGLRKNQAEELHHKRSSSRRLISELGLARRMQADAIGNFANVFRPCVYTAGRGLA